MLCVRAYLFASAGNVVVGHISTNMGVMVGNIARAILCVFTCASDDEYHHNSVEMHPHVAL